MDKRLYIRKPSALRHLSPSSHGVIAASAGTGKTYTLEHLVVEILLADDDARARIPEILLVTFTVAATSDLRRKIRHTLERFVEAWDETRWSISNQTLLTDSGEVIEALSPPQDLDGYWTIDAQAATRLRDALRHFDRAAIYTIHGFCQRVLKEHAFASQRLFEQEHVSESDVIEEAFAELLRQEILPGSPEEWWLQEVLASGKSIANVQELLTGFVRCQGVFMPSQVDVFAFPAYLDRLRAALEGRELAEFSSKPRRVIRKLQNDYLPVVADMDPRRALITLREVLGGSSSILWEPEVAKALRPDPAGDVLRDLPRYDVTREQLLTWLLGPRLQRRMEALKEREGYLTFDDMVRLVERNLQGPHGEELLASLRGQYKVALIDEFQDTDPHQWTIFQSVFAESPRHRLFLIGDPKQAIYGFRGGDVYTYLHAREELRRRGAKTAELSSNYRSTPAVIQAYNRLFMPGREPQVELGEGIDYPQDGVEAGRPTLAMTEDGEPLRHGITLMEVVAQTKDFKLGAVRHAIARAYADEIQELISGRFARQEGEPGSLRAQPISARDIYVLCRRTRDLDLMAEALRLRGIPFAFMKKDGLFQTPEAYDLYDLLLALDDPYDRSRRARIWMSPFFDLTLSDLEAIAEVDETAEVFQRLLRWSRLAGRRDIGDLFSTVVEESGLIRRRLLLSRGERELTNYLHLMEILVEETARRAFTLPELAQRLKSFIDGRANPGGDETDQQRLETEEHAVQLLTVHGSKGLERGVVFVFPRFSSPNYAARFGPKRFHVKQGEGKPHALVEWHGKKSELPSKYSKLYDAELFAEERRLAYVALTRAQLQVYMPFASKDSGVFRTMASGAFAPLIKRADLLRRDPSWSHLFRVKPVPLFQRAAHSTREELRADLRRQIEPHISLLTRERPETTTAAERQELRARRWEITSYSKLKSRSSSVGLEDEKADVIAAASVREDVGQLTLPGGMATGNFLHLVMEELDYAVAGDLTREEFLHEPDLSDLFDACARRFGAFDELAMQAAKGHVYDTLHAPVTLPAPQPNQKTLCLHQLKAARIQRELEFLFPVAEGGRHRFGAAAEIRGGFVTGIVDLLFEWEGRLYFADWKSDIAPPYDARTLGGHVADRYAEQALLYSLSVCRMLHITTPEAYAELFGGFLYFFLRGMTPAVPGQGIYTGKVPWEDLQRFSNNLESVVRDVKRRPELDEEALR